MGRMAVTAVSGAENSVTLRISEVLDKYLDKGIELRSLYANMSRKDRAALEDMASELGEEAFPKKVKTALKPRYTTLISLHNYQMKKCFDADSFKADEPDMDFFINQVWSSRGYRVVEEEKRKSLRIVR